MLEDLPYVALQLPAGPAEPDDSIDRFIHTRGKVLATKLEVLAAEVIERFRLRRRNREGISKQRATIETMLGYLDEMSRYHLREARERGTLYQAMFDLDRQAREQDVECWRDAVDVMRDFLAVWEAHEQTKARAVLLSA